MKVTGHCYCGAVRYVADGEPLFRGQCHCRECQYFSGGHPNVVIGMPAEGFKYTGEAPKQFARSDLETPVTREFCGTCGTHITTRVKQLPQAVLVKVGTLDEPGIFERADQVIYTIDAQGFHQFPEGVPTFERLPPH